jgi:hypothetical protein
MIIAHRFIKNGRPGLWWDGEPTSEEVAIAAERGASVQLAYDGQQYGTVIFDAAEPESTLKHGRDPWSVVEWKGRMVPYDVTTSGVIARFLGDVHCFDEIHPDLMALIEEDIQKGKVKK